MSKMIKTGFSLPPKMIHDLDTIASITGQSRSAVLVSLLDDSLHDIASGLLTIQAWYESHPGQVRDFVNAGDDYLSDLSERVSAARQLEVFTSFLKGQQVE